MFGWSIMARACRSASNRAITCCVSMPGLMIFRATLRRTGSRLLGQVDDAHAALADLLQQLVGADLRTHVRAAVQSDGGEHRRGTVDQAACRSSARTMPCTRRSPVSPADAG